MIGEERDDVVEVDDEQSLNLDDHEAEIKPGLEESETDETVSDSEEEEAESDEPDDGESDDNDIVVTIGEPEPDEESEHKEAPGFVKKLRSVNKHQKKEIRELKEQLSKMQPGEKPIELGEKPTLEGCKYDDKAYEAELEQYYTRKRKVDEQQAVQLKQQEEQKEAYQSKLTRYAESKKQHGFKDFEDAEANVLDSFTEAQQSIIVEAAEDSALLVYALGTNPKILTELAKEKNLVNFTYKLAKVEGQVKKTPRKKAPKPESTPKGNSGGISGTADETLKRLRAKAERTGDLTEVRKYKKKLRDGK